MNENVIRVSERLESAMAIGGIAWWEKDLPSGEIRFGKAKTDILGYDSNDFKHYSDFTKLLHKDDYEKAMTAMREHLHGNKKRYEVEYRILTKSGEYLWFKDIGEITHKDGDKIYTTGIVINITDQKRLEEEQAKNVEEIVQFNKMAVDRELKMIELKEEIKLLKSRLEKS